MFKENSGTTESQTHYKTGRYWKTSIHGEVNLVSAYTDGMLTKKEELLKKAQTKFVAAHKDNPNLFW